MNIKKIFVADDSILTRKQLTSILEEGGYEIIGTAVNGSEAVLYYSELKENVDLVTLDITMPVMDGIEALEKILEINPKANVIMVSSMGKENIIQKCLSIGAKGFIVKPFYTKRIFDAIKRIEAV
ncbi:MAG: response regulator [Spirochaetia bacterium]|nr:response regulator [Spirochaetia bacterium]